MSTSTIQTAAASLTAGPAASDPPTTAAAEKDPWAGPVSVVPPVDPVLRQDRLSVTLDAPALFALAVALVACVHFLSRAQVEAAVALAPVVLAVRNDYRNFIRLGPG